jgi:dihydropyrimidinase
MSDAWWDAGLGVNGLQRSAPVFHGEAVIRRRFSCPSIVRAVSTRPVETFWMKTKQQIAPGYDADIVLFDSETTQTVSTQDNMSLTDYSIHERWELTSDVDTTLVRD